MEYRKNTYFNDHDEFLFNSSTGHFVSRMHFYKGNWYTNERPNRSQYKATSLNCVKISALHK